MSGAFINPAAKLLQNIDRIALIKAGELPPPINVEIDLSNRCSLGCQWCHFAFTHTRGPLAGKIRKPDGAIPGGDLMDTRLALSIVDELAAFGVRSVTWTGGGEPTLHPDFDLIVEHAHGKVAQGLYTHGGHIDEDRAAVLKRCLDWVYVSLDAADSETYRRLKGVDRFEQAVKGIRRLVAADGDATVGIGYLVAEGNVAGVESAWYLAEAVGADFVQYRPTVLYDPADHSRIAETTGWIDGVLSLLEELAERPNVEVDLERFRMYRDWADHGYATCFWAALQSVITPNGKVWACVNKREHGDAELGDLSVETFAEAWARGGPRAVDGSCRVMCRGHLSNLALNEMMLPIPHAEFV